MGAVPVLNQGSDASVDAQAANLREFPSNFVWGVATAAYQVDGAVNEDGRGRSIWDTFSHTPGKVLNGDTGDVACDHYHRWPEDLALLRDLGVGAYRFSIAWPRIIAAGSGAPNVAGLDWYERLVDALLELGIAPWVTLYHWDLPQPLEDAGGWPERSTADAFARYVEVVARRLGDRVHTWITLNEPWCSAFLGYHTGEHAPGRRDPRLALAAAHTLLLAHGRAVDVLRSTSPRARVGIVLNPSPVEPATDADADVAAAQRADGYHNRWLLDPLYGRGYPVDMLDHFAAHFAPPGDDDLRQIAAPTDFLGVNYYFPTVVRADASETFLGLRRVGRADEPVTQMDWIVRPSGLRQLLVRLQRDYPVRSLAVTENGAAYADTPAADGQVHDPERTRYLAGHVAAAGQAIGAGVPLTAYFAWSFLDNFEWAKGYSRRFGVVYVDFATQRRTVKDSGRWYRSLIARSRHPIDTPRGAS
ncbi:MAG: beta-glucosidase [Chloroflexi bacterium]|nr:beta-glucosidase [Chloroflexota bacterium]